MNQEEENNFNKILAEYEYIIKILIAKYKILPKDYDDVMQEGRLGLLKAIKAFENNKGSSFCSFASLCIERQILSFLRNQGRKKNKILTNSFSLDNPNTDFESEGGENMCEYIISKLHYEDILNKIILQVSEFEKAVFQKYVYGYSISELSEGYNIPKKQVYVIIAKVKRRIGEKLNHL